MHSAFKEKFVKKYVKCVKNANLFEKIMQQSFKPTVVHHKLTSLFVVSLAKDR